MLKLFIRFYLLMLVLLLLSLVSLNLFIFDIPVINNFLLNGQAQGEIGPIFNYIEAQLIKAPQTDWQQILEKLTPKEPHHSITIVPINTITLPNTYQKNRLLQGKIVGTAIFFHPPMNDTTDSYKAYVYQRLPNSNLVLVMQNEQHERDSEFTNQIWFIHFIRLELAKYPDEPTNDILENFSRNYGVPVQFIPLASLPPEVQNYLQENQFLMDGTNDFNVFLSCYYLYSPTTVLKIGSFIYPWYMAELGSLLLGFLVIFISLVMFFSLYSFYRDLKKLDRLAQKYGEGDFDYKIKIGRFAAMASLYKNLKTMGNQIQKLLISHKELTQAVSHELKTPLARLKFALTMIEDSKKKQEQNTYIASANDAVNDLETLIGELLLYTSFDRQLFHPTHESIDISNTLLATLIESEEKHPEKTLIWDITPAIQGIKINMAAQYFEKIVLNLLSNAFRYAQRKINVSLNIADKEIILTIEDDGPGIPEAYRQKIFEPFFSLDESRNKELSGHGLGLAIVERLVIVHHGSISVTQSQNLGGAKFSIHLPIQKR